ncbi:MAG: RNA-binding S4 domain-containing protein [Proteobacteria bacterium]|nr:RNA-binding S4 domain-containing protein [Pseudomonadota bacterium]
MTEGAIRIDKWLWYARFFKSRTLATRLVSEGHVRVNRERVTKSHGAVRPGDVLTFPQGREIRVVKVLDCGERRGPATEAQALYEDLEPVGQIPADRDAMVVPAVVAERERGAGRPTKAQRRAMDSFCERAEGF